MGVGKEGQLGCLAGNVVLQSFGRDAQLEEVETVNFTNSAKVVEDQEQGERITTKEGGACLVVPSVEGDFGGKESRLHHLGGQWRGGTSF